MFYRLQPLIVLLLSVSTFSFAQVKSDSTLLRELDEVIVTATRTEKKLSNVAVPATVITQKNIQRFGTV